MIDNIYKAIIHAREVAKNWRSQLVNCVSEEGRCKIQERATEHELIADWLEELTERREADRWIPITEALPDIALHVLVQLTNGWITIGHYHSTDKWVFIDGTITIAFPRDTVVAWRYMPKSYESEVTNEQTY